MNILSDRPNLLFLIWVRNTNFNFIINYKLKRHIYYFKLINALTTIDIIITYDGYRKMWITNDKIHRGLSQDGTVGPAIISGISNDNPNGTTYSYYRHGKRHRDDGPAWIRGISNDNPNGTTYSYYKNGNYHRDDGPAYISGITKESLKGTEHAYYRDGELHRDDGPALIRGISNDNPNGTTHGYYKNDYYLHGKLILP